MITLPLSEVLCLLRNSAALCEYLEEVTDHTAPMVGLGVLHMAIDDTRACAKRIQKVVEMRQPVRR